MLKVIKSRIFIIILAALICIFGLFAYTNQANKKADIVKAVKLTVNVEAGTEITQGMLEIAEVGAYGYADIITDQTDVIGKYTSISLQKGDVLTKNKISTDLIKSGNILESLDGSQVAFSVSIKEPANSLSDKLRSGDIVSLYIYKDGEATSPEALKYVKVISAVTQGGTDKDNDSVEDGISTVMLLVTPEQAKELTAYEDNAEIHFALVYRGKTDTAQQFLDKQNEVLK